MTPPEASGRYASLDLAALDLLPDIVWVAGPDGTLIHANDAWRRLTRTGTGPLEDDAFAALLHPDDLQPTLRAWREAVAAGADQRMEFRLHDPDGVYRWYQRRAWPLKDAAGRVTGWIGAVTRIDAERRAAARSALLASINGLFAATTDADALIDAVPGIIVPQHADYAVIDVFDEDGSFERFTVAAPPEVEDAIADARERYRVAPSLEGTPWHVAATGETILLNQPETPAHWSDAANRLRDEVGIRSAIVVPLADGQHRLGALALGRLGDDATPFDADDVQFYLDLAARTAAAIRHARTTRELIDSERRYHTLADGLSDLVAVTGAAGSLLYVNEPWTRYTGVAANDAIGDGWERVIHPDDVPELLAALDRARIENGGFETQHRVRGADGAYRWFLHRGTPISANGVLSAWIGTATDIDQRKRLEDALRVVVEASAVFARTLDVSRALQELAELAAGRIADWCTIYVYDDAQRLQPVATAHADPRKLRTAREYVRRFAVSDDDDRAMVAATGRPIRVDALPAGWLSVFDDPAQRVLLAQLDVSAYLFVPLSVEDERLGVLALAMSASPRGFTDDDEQLALLLAQRAAIGIANARLYERQREVARTLQASFLPAALPQTAEVAFDGVYAPGTYDLTVGGDWYDALAYDEDLLGFSIGDVAGHGLEAAVTMGKMRQTFRALAVVERDPALALASADSVLRREHPDVFVTAFTATFERATRLLRYANAGHPPPYVRRPDGTLERLEAAGVPLGLASFELLATQRRTLGHGDLLVAFTDGLIETTRDIETGEREVARALVHPAFALCSQPAALLRTLVVPREPDDDVAILTVRAGDGPDWILDANDSFAARAAREAFVARLVAAGVDDDARLAAEVVFGEVIGNVARYTPGRVDLRLRRDERGFVLAALDRGPGFVWNAAPPRDEFAESGRGLFLIETLARAVSAEHFAGFGTYLEFVLAA
jgi:PAS domain S-box-containing protein